MRLSKSVQMSRKVNTVCLPDNLDYFKPGQRCVVTGWGHTSWNGSTSHVLREAWVDLVSRHSCNKKRWLCFCALLYFSVSHSSLTHLFTHSLIHSLTHSLIHSLTYLGPRSLETVLNWPIKNHDQRDKYHHLTKTLSITTAQVVETSVSNNSLSGDFPHPDDHTRQTTVLLICVWFEKTHCWSSYRNCDPSIVNLLTNICFSRTRSYDGKISERFLCAGFKEGGIDACAYDSGGPLVCPVDGGRWILAGIVSWGDKCALPHKYGVYTNVNEFTAWINGQLKKDR